MEHRRDVTPGEARAGRFRAAFGVDVGGTKMAVELLDAAGRILAEAEEPTDQSEPDAPVTQAVRLMRRVAAEAGVAAGGVAGVGVGLLGTTATERGRKIWILAWRSGVARPLHSFCRNGPLQLSNTV